MIELLMSRNLGAECKHNEICECVWDVTGGT